MFKKVFAGLALSTALVGGALTLGATAASAGCDNGGSNPWCNNNTNNNCWWNNNNCNQQNNNCFWNNSCFNEDDEDNSSFAIATPCVAIGFQDSSDDKSCWNNNSWWNQNNCWNQNDNCWWNNNNNDNNWCN